LWKVCPMALGWKVQRVVNVEKSLRAKSIVRKLSNSYLFAADTYRN
jgi:hypothetical protein